MKKKHVIVEGIDGSGKDTILRAFIDVAHDASLKVFDAVYFSKYKGKLPEKDDFNEVDVIATAEPTYAWVGKFIRDEVIREKGRSYTPEFTAVQYSSDRLAHYKMVVLPAISEGKIVLQARGAPSSFCYQPIQGNSYPLEKIISLEGNRLALEYQPDILIITKVEPKEAMERLKKRNFKDDGAIFEKLEFLKRLQPRYEGNDILPRLFNKSHIIYIDTNNKPRSSVVEESKAFARNHIFI